MDRRWSFVMLAALLAGCHRYEPARIGAVPEGAAVRVHLTQEGARSLEEAGVTAGSDVSGTLLEWGDPVVLSVEVPAAEGMLDRGLRQRVMVAPDQIVGVEVRERDRTRTAILVGGIVAVVATAAISALSGVFGGSDDPVPPGEPEGSLIPSWLAGLFSPEFGVP